MSSTDHAPAPSEPAIAPQELTNSPRPDPQLPLSSTPVEMSNLSSNPAASSAAPPLLSAQATTPSAPTSGLSKETSRSEPPIPAQTSATKSTQSPSEPHPMKVTRAYSTAIGPSSDQPIPIPKDESTGPILMITLLLTTGARHPFKIDPKYLSKRNVDVQGNDPFHLSVYKLKELILREWRDGMAGFERSAHHIKSLTSDLEWEQKPSSPSSIRLISFGKLLDDKAPLKGIPSYLLLQLPTCPDKFKQTQSSTMILQTSST